MYKNNYIFYPKDVYCNIDFSQIKNELKHLSGSYSDYGSIILLENAGYFLSVNNYGKLQLFYDVLDEKTLSNTIDNIENLFRKQISNFKILRN